MSIISIAECRALISHPISESDLLELIDRLDGELTEDIGPYNGTDSFSETIEGKDFPSILTRRPISSVTTLREYSAPGDTTGTLLTEGTSFLVWGKQGRIDRVGNIWGHRVDITYVPTDQTKKRKQAVIDLIRVYLALSPLASETVTGEFSYQSPDNWEAERRKIVRRLTFSQV
jgi:hypothetical protein